MNREKIYVRPAAGPCEIHEWPDTRLVLTARYNPARLRRVARELEVESIPASAFAVPAIPDVLTLLTTSRAARANNKLQLKSV